MMDILEIAIMICAILILFPLGFVVGKWMDLSWRVKMKRRYLKKPFILARLIDKDTKSELLTSINIEKDMIQIGDFTFLSNASRIYRQDKEEIGVKIVNRNIKWEEGVPIITLDRDTLQPLDYDYGVKTADAVKPDEVGATIGAHDAIQLQKSLLGKSNVGTMLMIILVVAGIAALLAYAAMDGSGQCVTILHQIQNSSGTGIIKAANGTQIIKGPGVP